ncbi:hypothetical protein D3C86_1549660 [compost metagenome]
MGHDMSSKIRLSTIIFALILSSSCDESVTKEEKNGMEVTPQSAPITPKPYGCENLPPPQSAEAEDAEGYWNLYVTYRSCEYSKSDWIRFIDRAVELGSDKAMYNKAILLLNENENSDDGLGLLRESAKRGNEEAKESLNIRGIALPTIP